MSDVDLEKLLEPHKGEVKAIADAAANGNRDKVIDGAAGLAVTLATGNPMLGALAPLGREAVARAFGSAVNQALDRELAQFHKEQERQAFFGQLDELLAALIGQALVQIVRSQHNVKDEVLAALGGLRSDFAEFRRDFAARLAAFGEATVQVDEQWVRGGSIGVRVREATTKRVRLGKQIVTGGSTGILLD